MSRALETQRRRVSLLVVAFGLLFPLAAISLFAVAAGSGSAAVGPTATDLVPTRFDDPAPDGCQPDDCSLREAAIDSETLPGHDRIILSRGVYTLRRAGADNTSQSGDLDFTGSVEILGPGTGLTTIDANGLDRAIDIDHTGIVTIVGLTIRNGRPGSTQPAGFFGHSHGAGIHNHGRLALSRVALSKNATTVASWGGGGLTNAPNTPPIPNATATLRSVTIARNKTDLRGAGIENGGNLDLFDVTVAENEILGTPPPPNRGGGVFNFGVARLSNTIVARNVGGDCEGPITSAGHNLAGDGTCTGLTAAGDAQNVNMAPWLNPLFDDSGFVPGSPWCPGTPCFPVIYELVAGTPGNPNPAIDTGGGCLSHDQLGVVRPQDGDGNGSAICDKGAFERALSADLSLAKTDSPDPVAVGSNLTYTLTVTNNGPGTATGVTVVDTLPAGTTFVSASPGCVHAAGTVTCDVGWIAPGADKSVTIVVQTTALGTITNTATVSSNLNDPNQANNSASATTEVRLGCFGIPATIIGSGVIFGTPGPDVIVGSNGPDTIFAGGGSDIVCSRAGEDVIGAAAGHDVVDAGAQADLLHGDGGDDVMWGGLGSDSLFGGVAIDTLNGDTPTGADPSPHSDVCDGGPGPFDAAASCEIVFGVP